jgi:hypothetical protein
MFVYMYVSAYTQVQFLGKRVPPAKTTGDSKKTKGGVQATLPNPASSDSQFNFS